MRRQDERRRVEGSCDGGQYGFGFCGVGVAEIYNGAFVSPEDIALFKAQIDEFRYDFCTLVYIIFPFGQKDHALEHQAPYDWQMEEWAKMSAHLANPLTRYDAYRLIISSGNGAAKTAFGAMTEIMLMYTQQLRSRITANTDPQMKSIVWPEYDVWYRHARFQEHFFEKLGTSIKAKKAELSETWRIDTVTWDEQRPASISGLHNKGKAISYVFEEAPGIPAVIWGYANGAFTETETIKIFMAFGNSDDPDSKFEQNMGSPLWHSRRIDTRTLSHIDKKFHEDLLIECNGNEDHDDFRVRVRGLPRKTARDSIINKENVIAALARGKKFDKDQLSNLPCILTCDPAWTGGDDSTIAYQQGPYRELLDKYKLDPTIKETHMLTFQKLCHWERELGADAVFIDQGEGTALYTLAMNAGKTNWFLISFASAPNDKPEAKDSEYGNIRAQMYYETDKWLRNGGILAVRDPAWEEAVIKQMSWTKGARHKVTQKKMCEAKTEIKARIGFSPDVADVLVLPAAMPVLERLPENSGDVEDRFKVGDGAYTMPEHSVNYDDIEVEYENLYD